MAKDVRERMVVGATELLASKGLQATSFSEVIELTRTPRGSIYHHFPGGKDELVLAALEETQRRLLDSLAAAPADDARAVLDAVVGQWRELLTNTELKSGCAAVAVTVATDSNELLKAAGGVFSAWQQRLVDLFVGAGLADDKASTFATMVLATIEGGVVIARAQRDIAAYDRAVALLPMVLDGLL